MALLALFAVAFALDEIPMEGDLTEQNDFEEDMDVAERSSHGYCPKACYKSQKAAWRSCYKYPYCKVAYGCKVYHHYKYSKGYYCKNHYIYKPYPYKKKHHGYH